MTQARGNPVTAVVGALFVVTGAAVLLERAGVVTWPPGVSLWPLIFIGFGIAKLVETYDSRPRHGYVPLLFGLWLLAGELGWIVLRESWPLLLVGLGIAMMIDVVWSPPPPSPDAPPRRPDGQPLMFVGVVLAIVLLVTSGQRRPAAPSVPGDPLHIVSVLGPSTRTSTPGDLRGGDLTTVMSETQVDLRQTTIAPGAAVTIDVFTLMGHTILRVPPGWILEVRVTSAAGTIKDQRDPAAAGNGAPPAGSIAPRLVLDGLVMMGELTIRS